MQWDYNSAYISINLVDELDYVIGGYGKPNSIFIYSLNAFLESFILNSKFYISDTEAKHIQSVSTAMFPHGRPILELLAKTNNLIAVGGIGNKYAKVVGIGKPDRANLVSHVSYQEQMENYMKNSVSYCEEIRGQYLVVPKLNIDVENIAYLNISKVDGGLLATETLGSHQMFYTKLGDLARSFNIQAALPFYNYKSQIEEVQSKGLSKQILSKLSDSFLGKHKRIEQYFGVSNQTIPPLVTILLSQCNSLSDIPEKAKQLREDFTSLRDAITKHEKKINEAETIKEQLDAIDEVSEFWKVFNKKYSEDSRLLYQFWELAEESDFEKSADNYIDNGDSSELISDLNLGKVAGRGVRKIFSWYKEKRIINRFKGVTDLWKLFEGGPSIKKQLPQFERVFNCKVDESELLELNKKIAQMKISSKA